MALYTVFAWTAIVVAGGAYYWIYIRQEPIPFHLLGLSQKPATRGTAADNVAVSSQKRKRKNPAVKRRPVTSQTNELIAGTSSINADDSELEQRPVKSTQHTQDESVGLAENKALKGDYQIRDLLTESGHRASKKTSKARGPFHPF